MEAETEFNERDARKRCPINVETFHLDFIIRLCCHCYMRPCIAFTNGVNSLWWRRKMNMKSSNLSLFFARKAFTKRKRYFEFIRKLRNFRQNAPKKVPQCNRAISGYCSGWSLSFLFWRLGSHISAFVLNSPASCIRGIVSTVDVLDVQQDPICIC